MRKTLSLLAVLAVAGLMTSGCAWHDKMDAKFGRGVANTADIARGGEFRRTLEQTALFKGPEAAYSSGFVTGVNRTLCRTGIGVIELVTAPFPPYHPLFTGRFAPGPVFPDNNTPSLISDPMFATDSELGFSGGNEMPFIPGNRFEVFSMH
jgi:putative exosortase-associated protein (TIGR04073 family)